MAVQTMEGTPDWRDPDQWMGDALTARERRQKYWFMGKVAIVWVGLVILLAGGLLQLRFDPRYVANHYTFVLRGIPITIGVSLASIFFATILALFGALGRLSNSALAQGIAGFYISVVRGTPLLIQIYLIYLGLPQIGQILRSYGLVELGQLFTLSAIQSGILALSLNYGAYMTEIFRAGIQSIAHGQHEAAASIGMTPWQTMRRIVLPQAVRIITPDIGNQFIAMQKDSALVSVMGIWEITFRANRFARQDSKFMEMFILAAMLYWILTLISTWLQERLERRFGHAYER